MMCNSSIHGHLQWKKKSSLFIFFAEENDMQFSEIPINSKEKIKQIPEQTHEIMPETIYFICPIIHMIGSPLSKSILALYLTVYMSL